MFGSRSTTQSNSTATVNQTSNQNIKANKHGKRKEILDTALNLNLVLTFR